MNRDVTEARRAREAQVRVQRQLDEIINNSPAVVYLKDVEGRYLLVNRRFQTLFHLDRDQVIGKRDADLFSVEVAGALA